MPFVLVQSFSQNAISSKVLLRCCMQQTSLTFPGTASGRGSKSRGVKNNIKDSLYAQICLNQWETIILFTLQR